MSSVGMNSEYKYKEGNRRKESPLLKKMAVDPRVLQSRNSKPGDG